MVTARRITNLIGLIIFMSLVSWVRQLSAQGFIIPRPVPHQHPALPELTQHHVEVDIDDQVAVVEVRQVFRNGWHRAIEGTYYFPLPKDAGVSEFKMIVDGKVLSGELLEKDKARKVYEDIVRRQIDPALLEYIDHNLFCARIFPIPPNQEREIILKYSSLLKLDGGLVQFSYPLRGRIADGRHQRHRIPRPTEDNHKQHPNDVEKGDPNTEQVINIDLRSKIPLKNIYSPSHEVDISRIDEHSAKISFEGKRKSSSESFVLYYAFSKSDFGLNLLTYRPEDNEDGFFMLLVSPKTEFSNKEILDKDIIFILDTSGSMEGDKIRQAKEALKYCINHLGGDDRFNVIGFSTESRLFKKTVVDASEYGKDALSYVDKIEAKGGTNISDALLDALKMNTGEKRPLSIVFITDGLPTVGETNVENIIRNVSRNNKNDIKIFTFGVGYDVNTILLDRIADESRSVSDYIEPSENIEQKISGFYDKIRHPVLTDLVVDYAGIKIEDVYPRKLPDLFKGSQLTVLGRYSNGKKVTITMKGKVKGEEKKFAYPADFSATADYDFLPHLWATRKVGYLMDEIRLHGENQELKDEIIRLSKKFGVMSPYTSYLVQDEELMAAQPQGSGVIPATMPGATRADMAFEAAAGLKKAEAMIAAAPKDKGVVAVHMSKRSREMKEAEALTDDTFVKRIGSRTFFRKNGFWVDSEYKNEKIIDIKYGSQAYTEFLLTYPDAAKFLTLGEKVIFKYKDRFVKISDEGKANLGKDDLKKLFH
jgi:Ca-activated chloride channel family protein